LLDDLMVSASGWPGKLETCGQVRIDKRSRTVTRFVQAGDGVEVQGVLEARISTSGGVLVRRGGRVKGDIEATSITVEPGATLEGTSLCIRPLPSASPQ
jgi:cytoskeletal protein CcmA (bactofilin family)